MSGRYEQVQNFLKLKLTTLTFSYQVYKQEKIVRKLPYIHIVESATSENT